MPTNESVNEKKIAIQVPSFVLEDSALLSETTRKVIQAHRDAQTASIQAIREISKDSFSMDGTAAREQERLRCYQSQAYKSIIAQYPVDISTETIGGVLCEVFTPLEGIAAQNTNRILINLHGGAFESGSRTSSQLESIPVAALGKIKVISVDYRMAPEYVFPAASDDVVAVYQALLSTYQPDCIGLYGTSAGAELSAQVLVRLQQINLPLPGAVAMIAGGTTKIDCGDSVAFVGAIQKATLGIDLVTMLKNLRYYEGADMESPEVTPSQSDDYMRAFPPSLLAASSRDFVLSQVLVTHAQLVRLGIETELHVWEGLDHVFHYNPDFPETEELHQVICRFFQKHLAPL